jgi:hypothetical protein
MFARCTDNRVSTSQELSCEVEKHQTSPSRTYAPCSPSSEESPVYLLQPRPYLAGETRKDREKASTYPSEPPP